ncbi:hypothetical protein Ahia01_000723200 [Argonauta hians]
MGESEYACQSQYDATFTTAQDVSTDRIFEGTLLKKAPENNWKGLETGVQLQELTPVTQQPAIFTHSFGNKDGHVDVSSEHVKEMTVLSSYKDTGHSWREGSTEHYEELAGFCPRELAKSQSLEKKMLSRKLSRPSNTAITTSSSCHTNVASKTPCTDVIDLKSFRVGSEVSHIKAQSWNLPTGNSFTTYSKPLPAVPKVIHT